MMQFWITFAFFVALFGSATAFRGLHASSVGSTSLTGPLNRTSYYTSADYGEGGKAMSAYGSTCSSLCQGCTTSTYWSLSTESGLGAAVTVTLMATDRTYKGPSWFNISVSTLDADGKLKLIWQSGPTDCVQATFISPSNVPCNRWRVDFKCLKPWASQDPGCEVEIGLRSHQPASNGAQPNVTEVVDGRCARHSPNPPSRVDRANFGVDKTDPNKNQKEYEVFSVRQQVCPGYEMDLDCCQAYRWCSGGSACSSGNSTTVFTCTAGIAQCACTAPPQTVNPAQVPSLPVYENWLHQQNQEREARRQRRQFQLEKQQAELQEQQQAVRKQIEQQERQTSAQLQQPSTLQKQLAILQDQQQAIQRDLQQVQNATGPATELQEPPTRAVLSHMWNQLTVYYPDEDAFRRRAYSRRILEPCLKENFTTGTLILASELVPACIDACLAGFKVWVYNGQSCNMVIMAPFAGTNSPFIPAPGTPPSPKTTSTGQGREFTEVRSGLYSRQVIFKDEAPKVTSWGTGAPPGGWVAALNKAPAGVPRTNPYSPKANPHTQSQQSRRLLEFWEKIATGTKGNMTGSVGSTSNNNKAVSAPPVAPPAASKTPPAVKEEPPIEPKTMDWGPSLDCFGVVGTAEFDENGYIQSMEGQFKQDPADDSMPWPVTFVRTADLSIFSATIGPSKCPAVFKASEGLTQQARVSGVNMTRVSQLTLLMSLLAALLLAHLAP